MEHQRRHLELAGLSERSPSAKRELMEMLEAERGRDQLGQVIKDLHRLIQDAQLEEKDAGALERCLKGVHVSSLNYLEAVIDHYSATDNRHLMNNNLVGWQQSVMTADTRRTFAHNALLDAMRILVRNAIRLEVAGSERYQEYMVEPEEGNKRRWLGKLALIHAFNAVIITVMESL